MKRLINLERLKQSLVNEFGITLKAVDAYLQKAIFNREVKSLNSREIKQLTTNADKELQGLFGAYTDGLKSNWRTLFSHRHKVHGDEAYKATRQRLNSPKSLMAYADKVFDKPLHLTTNVGISLDELTKSFSKTESERIIRAIRLAHSEGLTNDKLVQLIRGSRANRYQDGILRTTTRNAHAIARTGTAIMASEAKQAFINDNKDIIKGIKVIATLDSRTSPICRHLDHQFMPTHKAKYPPYHFNCRSSFEIIYDGYESPKNRASESGVTENVGYYEWLKKQDKAYIQSVLGKKKAQTFLSDGMTADKFKQLGLDRSFMPMGLDELIGVEHSIKTVDFTGLKVDAKEVRRLLVDLLDNKPKSNEAMAVAEYQAYFGVTLTRPKPEYDKQGKPKAGFDYWVDDKQKLDFMFTMHGVNAFKLEKFNQYFAHTDDAWSNQKAEIMRHLDKADIVPLDLRYLTDENRVKLIDFVLSLTKEQQKQIVLIEGKIDGER